MNTSVFRQTGHWTWAVIVVFATPALADHGRFLLDPVDSGLVFEYGNPAPTPFDQAVADTTKGINAGMIKFDYDTYTRKPAGNVSGGGALSGGFFMNAGVNVKPGFELHWVQTVIADVTGQNNWNLPAMNAGEFPDATPASPVYPNESVPTNPLGMAPTLGFQDFPNRFFAAGNQNWQAELGLVCISDTANLDIEGMLFREVRVIDTLLWGFDLVGLPAATPGIANVAADAPAFWSDPVQSYLDTLNAFYDGMGGGPPAVPSTKYKFFNNDNCFIPEPASLTLLAFGALLLNRRRRR